MNNSYNLYDRFRRLRCQQKWIFNRNEKNGAVVKHMNCLKILKTKVCTDSLLFFGRWEGRTCSKPVPTSSWKRCWGWYMALLYSFGQRRRCQVRQASVKDCLKRQRISWWKIVSIMLGPIRILQSNQAALWKKQKLEKVVFDDSIDICHKGEF